MYSWDSDTSDWRGSVKGYKYSKRGSARRARSAAAAAAAGPRTYARKGRPDTQRTDPKKRIRSPSANPMIVGIDVTGSMAQWPFEIFVLFDHTGRKR